MTDTDAQVNDADLAAFQAGWLDSLLDDPLADDWEDLGEPLLVTALRQNQVNGMLRSMRKLSDSIAEYDVLHENEIARLNQQRDKVVGPLQRRYNWLSEQVHAYGVASWRLNQTAKTQLPYGTIKSTATRGEQINVDDVRAIETLARVDDGAAYDSIVEPRPKVLVGELRKWLNAMEGVGRFQRVIRSDSDDVIVLPKDQGWVEPFRPGETGVWMDVETGELLDGITWTPSGDDGCGRNFKIELT